MEKRENIVMNKSYAFALRIIKLYKYLIDSPKEYVLSKQVLRSGTSIGALIKEAEHAQSKADFINKMIIALKEANEYIGEKMYTSMQADIAELIKLLASIVKTSKVNNGK